MNWWRSTVQNTDVEIISGKDKFIKWSVIKLGFLENLDKIPQSEYTLALMDFNTVEFINKYMSSPDELKKFLNIVIKKSTNSHLTLVAFVSPLHISNVLQQFSEICKYVNRGVWLNQLNNERREPNFVLGFNNIEFIVFGYHSFIGKENDCYKLKEKISNVFSYKGVIINGSICKPKELYEKLISIFTYKLEEVLDFSGNELFAAAALQSHRHLVSISNNPSNTIRDLINYALLHLSTQKLQ